MRASPLTAPAMEEVVRQLPKAVAVFEAESGQAVYTNARAQEMAVEILGELAATGLDGEYEIFHLDGTLCPRDEWPVVRSMTAGEQVVDEEYFHKLPDGRRMILRCSASPVYDQGEGDLVVGGVVTVEDVTEHKRTVERLAYHASLLDALDDAVVGTDPDFRLTIWNPGAEKLYGYTQAEVLGLDAREVASYEGDTSRVELEAELLASDRTRSEFTAYRKDGEAVTVELVCVAVRDAEGALTGYLGVHRDVGERRQAEERLRASQERIETILASISVAFYAMDHEWRLTYVNDQAVQFASALANETLSAVEMLGRTPWSILPSLAGTTLEDVYRRCLRDQQTAVFEFQYPGGGPWFDVHVYPSGQGLSVYFQEITARKLADEEREKAIEQQAQVAGLGLRALSTDRPDSLMEDAVELVAETLGVDQVAIVEVLPGTGQLGLRTGTGWDENAVRNTTGPAGKESLVGRSVAVGEPVMSDDLARDTRFSRSSLTGHAPASAAAVPISTPDGAFGALAVFCVKARRFWAAEISFLQAVANVVATAIERAEHRSTLSEAREDERRRVARDLHDEALQGLTDALGAAASAEAAAGTGSNEDAPRLVPMLKRVGHQLRAAIYDLRLAEDDHSSFDALLKTRIALHRSVAGECEIQLETEEDAPTAALGPRAIEVLRVVGEAVGNARRHAGARTIRIHVGGAEDLLRIEISDDGDGFDATTLGGAGLQGMRERAALVGGSLEVHSRRGAGTRVVFTLDVSSADPVARTRVLLVEDHTSVRQSIAAMFEREPDLEVVAQAASLEQARAVLAHAETEVDVAVIDLGLPDGYGADLLQDLRETNSRAQGLVLSANLDRAEIARAVQAGAAGALDKSVRLDEVVDAVRRVRAGESLLPMDEIVELLRFAGRRREQEYEDRRALELLTAREREVLQALAEGLDSQRVADRLHISVRTERNHVASILAKLGVHSRLQALVFALRYDLVRVRR